ncbi:Myogenesis-Regulating Glycosidase [Manis pentadactyla]|nr:Myogenesis-Regulating Glycosidase [Manis pentadactyla]
MQLRFPQRRDQQTWTIILRFILPSQLGVKSTPNAETGGNKQRQELVGWLCCSLSLSPLSFPHARRQRVRLTPEVASGLILAGRVLVIFWSYNGLAHPD